MKLQKICIILIILVLFLTGCSNNENQGEDLHKKVDTEIKYIDGELIKIISQLNNINFSNYMLMSREINTSANSSEKNEGTQGSSTGETNNEQSGESDAKAQDNQESNNNANQKINVTEMVANSSLDVDHNDVKWSEILSDLEVFNVSWNTIILDLYKLNISNVDITSFSDKLNQLLINVKNKDKAAALTNTAALYSYLPKYLNAYFTNSSNIDLTETKLHILNSYVGATNGDWTTSDNELTLAEQAFSNVMKNKEFVNQKEYNINKTYITLKELQTSNQYKDTNIFFLKYRNLIQEIDVL